MVEPGLPALVSQGSDGEIATNVMVCASPVLLPFLSLPRNSSTHPPSYYVAYYVPSYCLTVLHTAQ